MLSILKNTVFVFWLLRALASLSIGTTVFALQAMATATRLSLEAAICKFPYPPSGNNIMYTFTIKDT
jgi:hypothetical protein